MDRKDLRKRVAGDRSRNIGLHDIVFRGALVAILAAALGACAGTTTAGGANSAAQKVALNFDLSKCQPMGANMYKCPAVDKPICSPDYAPSSFECVQIGKKGSVYVQQMEE